jgi:hypothetical protein
MRCIFLFLLTFLPFSISAQTTANPIIFQWISKPNNIKVLDSLINASFYVALDKSDYNTIAIKKMIRHPASILNYKDSLTTEMSIQKTAIHFFNYLAYGNKPPALDYRGANFDMIAINIPILVQSYLHSNRLVQLVQMMHRNCVEVKIILDSLHILQQSTIKNLAKISLLMKAANEYRWLNAVRSNNRIVLVNIPSAHLKVYEGSNVILQMNLILGKSSTPTKTLSTYIDQVTINPYWTVPKSIIVKEMIPKIQKDVQYLSKNRLSVLNENYQTAFGFNQPSRGLFVGLNWQQ